MSLPSKKPRRARTSSPYKGGSTRSHGLHQVEPGTWTSAQPDQGDRTSLPRYTWEQIEALERSILRRRRGR